MPILKGAASDFTRYQKVNAESLVTTAKPTASTAVAAKATVASVVKATVVAAKVAPKSAVIAQANVKVNTSKRG